jgi:hypothetical protein
MRSHQRKREVVNDLYRWRIIPSDVDIMGECGILFLFIFVRLETLVLWRESCDVGVNQTQLSYLLFTSWLKELLKC